MPSKLPIQNLVKDVAVLFMLNSSDSTANLAGDMPRGKQFGYLFTGADGNTAAHEIGHGVFKLEHTFSKYGFAKNDLVGNMMNYPPGEKLTKFQWDAIHAPGIVVGVFESDGDGQEQIDNYFVLRKATTFLSPANKIISLPTGSKVSFYCVDYSRTNNGVLHGFILPDGRKYYMRQIGWVGTTFVGYQDASGKPYLSQQKEQVGKQLITYLHHYQIQGQTNFEYWLVEHEVDVKGDQISAEKDFSGTIHEIEYKADRPGENFIVTLSGCGIVTDLSVAGKYKLKVTKDEKTGKLSLKN